MAEDDPTSDEDEVRALAALRGMDEARRKKMVEMLERTAKQHPRDKAKSLYLILNKNKPQ
ncbi:hypothetical protein FHW58_003423 [Duganella sp. 1224]|uniref:hypothetical protein n=1 Tax=Duganella sp. 1224 TaxID=2587052 RepID=UPI0015C8DFE0|nr:hypothetical protein [Duganella sp. 1224]NYE62208.1 hypothetical protein [Duganella sp. 1224]